MKSGRNRSGSHSGAIPLSKSARKRRDLTLRALSQTEEINELTSPYSPWIRLTFRKERSMSLQSSDWEDKSSNESLESKGLSPTSIGSHHTWSSPPSSSGSSTASVETVDSMESQPQQQSTKNIYNSIECLRIQLIARPFLAQVRDNRGQLPLHNSISRRDANLQVVTELIKRYPQAVRTRDNHGIGTLPLFLACQQKYSYSEESGNKIQTGIIRALCQSYPDAASKKIYGCLALHQLMYKNSSPSLEVVKSLINANRAAASVPNTFGNLPLHYLCESSNNSSIEDQSSDSVGDSRALSVDVLRYLIDAYPAAVSYLNKSGKTPLDNFYEGIRYFPECTNDYREYRYDKDLSSLGYAEATCGIALSSFHEMQLECLRILLCFSSKESLNDTQLSILRSLNWKARRLGVLASYAAVIPSDDDCGSKASSLSRIRMSCVGVWRHIICFL